MSIEFKQVSHTYDANSEHPFQALNDVDLKIENGGFYAIIGETGSGKTTLMQHLNGLIPVDSGEIVIDDIVLNGCDDRKKYRELRRKVGYVFQFAEYQLFEDSVIKDVAFGPTNFNLENPQQLAAESLKLVGLDPSIYDNSPFELSGGQKRRVAIAGVLASNPDILILDEPTAGLDPKGSHQMMELFKKLHRDHHKTILMVTHNLQHVLDYADHVVVMQQGRVKYQGNTDDFFADDELLASLSLALPQVVELKKSLQEKGFNLSKGYDLTRIIKQVSEEIKHG